MAIVAFTTTVSTKGKVILPKAIRDQLRWEPGTRLAVETTAEGVLLRLMPTIFAPTSPDEVFGCLSYDGEPKKIGHMDAVIAIEAKRRHARDRY